MNVFRRLANGSAVVVDLQHGAAHVGNVQPMLAAIRARGKRPLVRVPAKGEAGTVGRVLDLGAAGVICPLVNTAEEARALVQACRYPPRGRLLTLWRLVLQLNMDIDINIDVF